MIKSIKIILLSLVFTAIFGLTSTILAQKVLAETTEAVILDENVQASDLGISEPKLLPDSPFYFLKDWGRTIRFFFAFNPLKKVELRHRFASERLIEIQKMVEKKTNPKKITKAISKYEQEISRLKERSDKLKTKATETPELDKFLDKYTRHQTLHHRILQKLENQAPKEVVEKIKEARKQHLERFKEVMLKLENKEKISERIEKGLKEIRGSKFKEFKDLEWLGELEEEFPEEVEKKLKEQQEKILGKLYEKLEKLPPEEQEKFKEYLEEISGDVSEHLGIISLLQSKEFSEKIRKLIEEAKEKKIEEMEKNYEEIAAEKAQKEIDRTEEEIAKAEEALADIDPENYQGKGAFRLLKIAKEHLKKAKEAYAEEKYGRAFGLAKAAYHEAKASRRIAERIKRLKESPEELREEFEELYPGVPIPFEITKCPLIEPPRCQGRIVIERDSNGCPISKCEPQPEPSPEEALCYMLWKPVCGKDGQTYPNDCIATKVAGIEIAYEGICKEKEETLKEMKTKMEEEMEKILEQKKEELQQLKKEKAEEKSEKMKKTEKQIEIETEGLKKMEKEMKEKLDQYFPRF